MRVLIRLGHSKASILQTGPRMVRHLRMAAQREVHDGKPIALEVINRMGIVAVKKGQALGQIERFLLVATGVLYKLLRLALAVVIWEVVEVSTSEMPKGRNHRGSKIISIAVC